MIQRGASCAITRRCAGVLRSIQHLRSQVRVDEPEHQCSSRVLLASTISGFEIDHRAKRAGQQYRMVEIEPDTAQVEKRQIDAVKASAAEICAA